MPKKLSIHSIIKPIIVVLWVVLSSSALFIVIIALTMTTTKNTNDNKSNLFSAKPLVLGTSTSYIESNDARAASIDSVFEKYRCPIAGYGEEFVKQADKYDIPYWLVASIAFQESSCGKNVPKKDGIETFNLYGWGVWGDNVKDFDSMEHGIETVSKYMSKTFYSQGITDLCEIMKTYTPPSNGSWCKGVAYFRDEILDYETNQTP